jgi:hypothetical protein
LIGNELNRKKTDDSTIFKNQERMAVLHAGEEEPLGVTLVKVFILFQQYFHLGYSFDEIILLSLTRVLMATYFLVYAGSTSLVVCDQFFIKSCCETK